MNNKSTLTTILLLSALLINAQPVIEWQRSLGGSKSDNARCVKQTSDGGFIIAASSTSIDGMLSVNHGIYDVWIVKLKSDGAFEWEKSFGGSLNDNASYIEETYDGGFIVAAYSESEDGDISYNHGFEDYWIVKLTSTGEIEWEKSFGGSSFDFATCIKETIDGGFIAAGYTNSDDGDVYNNKGADDIWVIKLSNTGALEWSKTYGGTGNEYAHSIVEITDNGFIISGFTDSNDGDVSGNHGNRDVWILKIKNDGVIDWQKTFGGLNWDVAYSIDQTFDEGYIVAGYTSSSDGDITSSLGANDYWVLKLSINGVIEWQKTYGGSNPDVATSILQTPDGGYVVSGSSSSNDGDVLPYYNSNNYWLIKLSSTGQLKWQKSLGGSSSEAAYSIDLTSDNGFVISGFTVSSNGDVTSSLGGSDIWIVKLKFEDGDTPEDLKPLPFCISPNPASNQLSIQTMEKFLGSTFTVYDIKGRSILSGRLNADITKVDFQNIANGVYTFQIDALGDIETYRVVKQ